MKIHLFPNGFAMIGKAWEIRAKLKEYNRSFDTVEEWVKANHATKANGNNVHKKDHHKLTLL